MPKIDLKKAAYLQKLLSSRVIDRDEFEKPIKYIAGVDVAYYKNLGIGVAVLLDYETLKIITYRYSIVKIEIPYIPTFLAFREVPPMISAIKKLHKTPNITLIDAHGSIHPRSFGAASHIGVVLNIPTIGVAKSHLIGKVDSDGYIIHKEKLIGFKMKPKIYVSIGHKVSLSTAIKIIRHVTLDDYPEPTRKAHQYANNIKRDMITNSLEQ